MCVCVCVYYAHYSSCMFNLICVCYDKFCNLIHSHSVTNSVRLKWYSLLISINCNSTYIVLNWVLVHAQYVLSLYLSLSLCLLLLWEWRVGGREGEKREKKTFSFRMKWLTTDTHITIVIIIIAMINSILSEVYSHMECYRLTIVLLVLLCSCIVGDMC